MPGDRVHAYVKFLQSAFGGTPHSITGHVLLKSNSMPDVQVSTWPILAVAASFTAEPLQQPLSWLLSEAGLDLEVRFAPYHQLYQELLSRTSLLAKNEQGANLVLVRFEDFVRDVRDPSAAATLLERTTVEFLDALTRFGAHARSPTIVALFSASPRAPAELLPQLEQAASVLHERAKDLPGIYLLPVEATEIVYDAGRDELAHIPFTEETFASLALAIARKVHALRKPAHKVLVLDCDNTLWSGVVGEDGVDGISFPQAMLDLHRFAVDAQANGTLVCLASKNLEQDVLDVFARRPEMVLKAEHIVAHRINWKSKSENIASLARELNLGLDSFVFLDDNPVECAQVRAALPQVVTLQLPEAEIAQFLARLWVFDKVAVTAEDARRTKMYRENAARQAFEASAADIGDFIASLGLVVDIDAPAENEWPRVAQLTQRTNQFNFTTLRRTELELRSAAAEPGSLVQRVNVRDRFGDYGLVGLLVAKTEDSRLRVDTLLLSCRVLGRGVEHAMLRRLGEVAAARNLSHVDLPVIPTAKNEPAQAFAASVAGSFGIADEPRILYRIPVEFARGISHRPGEDPEAVTKARSAGEAKEPSSAPSDASIVSRSERYARLASELVCGGAILEAVRAKSLRARNLDDRLEEPATETEGTLAALWRELLNVKELGVQDDYFALGGTSLIAAQLFAEIRQRFGLAMPLTTILDHPSVRALARAIDAQRLVGARGASSGVLVELKPGGERHLFLIHDGDGETLLYRNLARRMPDHVAVFGIEPRRLSGVPLAHTRIEDMAKFYIDQMRGRQPRGPYLLGGLCAGGVIAYEMASQLKSAGEAVQLVALFDAAKPRARKRAGRIAKQRARRLEAVFAGIRGEHGVSVARLYASLKQASGKLVNALAWEVSSRARRLATRARFRVLHRTLEGGHRWPSIVPELTVREIYDSAEARYFPRALSDAGIMLLRAQSGDSDDQPYREVYADETFEWRSVAQDIAVVDVKGGHSSMLQEPFVESLVKALAPKVAAG
jgi:FkbH-like protein